MAEIKKYPLKIKKGTLLVICIVLGVIAAFRGNAGTDSLSYQKIYEEPALYFIRTDVEIGYKLLMYLCNGFGCSYRFLFFLMAFFTSLFFLLAIEEEKQDVDIETAFFVFYFDFYLMAFNSMRQSMAMSLCMYAMIKWRKRDYIKAGTAVCTAITFHYPAMICLVVFVYIKLLKSKRYKLILALSFMMIVWGIINHHILVEWVVYLKNGEHYQTYFYGFRPNIVEGVVFYLIKIFPIILFALCSCKFAENKGMQIYFGLMLLGYSISLLGEIYTTEIERLGFYLSCFRILVLGYAANNAFKIKLADTSGFIIKKKNSKTIVLIYIFVVYYFNIFIKGACEIVPYGMR